MSFRILLYFIYFLILPVLCSDDILPLYLWIVNSFWLYFEYIFRIFVLNYCHYWSFYVFSSYCSLYVITLPVWDQGFLQYVWKRLLQDVPHSFWDIFPAWGNRSGLQQPNPGEYTAKWALQITGMFFQTDLYVHPVWKCRNWIHWWFPKLQNTRLIIRCYFPITDHNVM